MNLPTEAWEVYLFTYQHFEGKNRQLPSATSDFPHHFFSRIVFLTYGVVVVLLYVCLSCF